MSQFDEDDLKHMLEFLRAPEEDEQIIAMDCSDCDKLAALAEQVAAGAPVEQVLPELAEHIHYWRDCREEFEALVAVLKAESGGGVSDALDQIARAVSDDDSAGE